MQVTLIRRTQAATHLKLDADAINVLSAVLQFTSKLNPRCQQLLEQIQPLLAKEATQVSAAPPYTH